MRFAEFVRNSGSPVAYYPRLAIALGGVKEAVFVSYCIGKGNNQILSVGFIKPSRKLEQRRA